MIDGRLYGPLSIVQCPMHDCEYCMLHRAFLNSHFSSNQASEYVQTLLKEKQMELFCPSSTTLPFGWFGRGVALAYTRRELLFNCYRMLLQATKCHVAILSKQQARRLMMVDWGLRRKMIGVEDRTLLSREDRQKIGCKRKHSLFSTQGQKETDNTTSALIDRQLLSIVWVIKFKLQGI